MIIFFTGTGNSKYVADALADRLGDETLSMNELIRNGGCRSFESDVPFIIVCPIYAWRIPAPVDRFLDESEFKGNRKIYVIVTMGAEAGKAEQFVSETLSGKDLDFMGLGGIAMTDNYVNWSKMPEDSVIEETNRKALAAVDGLAEKITAGEHISVCGKTRFAGIKSGFINRMFSKYTHDPGYTVSDSCTGCGMCEEFCPSGNIIMVGGRPTFSGNCFGCYGCLHRCPAAAIDLKGKVAKNGQFVCPEYRKTE